MKFLNAIISFLPWIAYSVLSSLYPALAFPIAILLCLTSPSKLMKGFIVDWGSLFFFLYAYVDSQILKNLWFLKHMSLFSSFFFVAIFGLSLAIRRPITLQYAKLEVEKKLWDSPHFFRVNQIMTGVLGMLFLAMSLINLYNRFHPGFLNAWLLWGIGAFLQVWFINRFPKWYKKRHLQKTEESI